VEQAAQERLTNGLATLPDVLEAWSATAQAEYDLQSALGAEEIARGDLATAVGTSASVAIRVQPLDQLSTPDSSSETVEETFDPALAAFPGAELNFSRPMAGDTKTKEFEKVAT